MPSPVRCPRNDAQTLSAVERGGFGGARPEPRRSSRTKRSGGVMSQYAKRPGLRKPESLCLTNVYGPKLNQSGGFRRRRTRLCDIAEGNCCGRRQSEDGIRCSAKYGTLQTAAVPVCGLSNDVTARDGKLFSALSNVRGGEAERYSAAYLMTHAGRMSEAAANFRLNFGGTWKVAERFITSSQPKRR